MLSLRSLERRENAVYLKKIKNENSPFRNIINSTIDLNKKLNIRYCDCIFELHIKSNKIKNTNRIGIEKFIR